MTTPGNTVTPEMPEKLFTVIDTKTGQLPDLEEIALKEEWAKGLCYCDMEGFVMDAEGDLFLLDECGNYVSVPEGRFVAMPNPNPLLTEAREWVSALIEMVPAPDLQHRFSPNELKRLSTFLERVRPL